MINLMNIEDQLKEELGGLTRGIRSVVILTKTENRYTINTFIQDQSKAIHELLANTLQAVKGIYRNPFYIENIDWSSDYVDSDSWNDGDKKTNEYISTELQRIAGFNGTHMVDEDGSIFTEDVLLREYNIYYGKLQAIEGRLKELKEKHRLRNYVLISNFNDHLGYFKTDTDNDRTVQSMIEGWLYKESQLYKFSLGVLAGRVDSLKNDPLILVEDELNYAVNHRLDEAGLRLRHGFLFKVPQLGRKFYEPTMKDVNNDVELQRVADQLKMVNPRTYFGFFKTKSAMYITIPIDVSDKALITAMYFTYGKLLNSLNESWETGINCIINDLNLNMRQFDYDPKLNRFPLVNINREEVLSRFGRRTRRFTQAGRNLASYTVSDISAQLNKNPEIEDFIIAYSMRNRDQKLCVSDSVKNLRVEILASLINEVCYMFGGLFGAEEDNIWHAFDEVLQAINSKDFETINKRLNLKNKKA